MNKKNKLCIATYITLITFTVINIINYESIMLQHKTVNKLEKEEVGKIEQYIEQYENNTGIKVTQIAKVPIYKQKDKGYFPNTKNKTSFTHNALKTSWASDGVINFYTKRNLKTIELTKKQIIYNYENFDKNNEYQCVGDTLYIHVYIF